MINQQLQAFSTLTRHELVRMFRIITQVFFPPVITTALYFLIFGQIIGQRIGDLNGISYAAFITPGLMMMSIITNAYANVSNSLFSARFQRSIEEMLVSPMHPVILLAGYTFGGILRGIIVAVLVYIVSLFFVTVPIINITGSLVVIFLVSSLFSLAGFANALYAKTFDHVAFVPTFILAPLSYLGGIFYTIAMLPEFWQHVTLLNPVFYMVNALRQTMLGTNGVNLWFEITMFVAINALLVFVNLRILRQGKGLRF